MSDCLGSLDALIVHGANGTCGPPGALAALPVLIALGTIALLLALRLSRRREARFAIGAIVVIASVPGVLALGRRADAPFHAPPAGIVALREAIDRFSAANGDCVELIGDSPCVACTPIAWRSLAPRNVCGRGAPATIWLGSGALDSGRCTTTTPTQLVCGAPR